MKNCERKIGWYDSKCCYVCGTNAKFFGEIEVDHTTECDKARIKDLEDQLKSLKKKIIGIANIVQQNNDEDD